MSNPSSPLSCLGFTVGVGRAPPHGYHHSAAMAGAEQEDDYMGDLSAFLPPEDNSSSKMSQKIPGTKRQFEPPAAKSKRPKALNWQEQRRLERERKQREEDERTLAGLEAAIPPSNVGFKMLKMMGYKPGESLGKEGGRVDPVGLEIRRSRAGIGKETPAEEWARKEKEAEQKNRQEAERMKHREKAMMEEFGSWQKIQWRSRRILADYHKAEAALAQLENRDVVEPEKAEEDGDENGEKTEDDEEEAITEEDLQNILIKLREEYRYCLYCGCQYESTEALQDNCPGPDEEDH